MADHAGLRERKRQRMHEAVSAAAISMFMEHGFDRVSVADIAAAAEVSKPTLFRYFPSKEDLVLHRIADHQEEAARVVRQRPAGQTPLAALHEHVLDGLARRDPVTGLNDHPKVLALHNMIFSTPSLSIRLNEYILRDEEALADALAEPPHGPDRLTARLAAAQIIGVQRILARENWRRLAAGETADELYETAKTSADNAFRLLASGLDRLTTQSPAAADALPPYRG
jgi:AcrR family transcriptional regulator